MTLAELRNRLQNRIADAEAMRATAPVAAVLGAVLTDLEGLDGVPNTTPQPDRLLTLEEAAERLGVTTRWLRENRPTYVVEMSSKMLRVSERKLSDWLGRH